MEFIGSLNSLFSFGYAFSKFSGGFAADFLPSRFVFVGPLFGTGLCCILFSILPTSFHFLFRILWMFNGLFQALALFSVAKLLANWFLNEERGTWWGIISISANVGSSLITLLGSFLCKYFNWRYALGIPGLLTSLIAFGLYFLLYDSPEAVGFPSLHPRDIKQEAVIKDKQEPLPLWKELFQSKTMWLLSITSLFQQIPRTAISDLAMYYLESQKHFTNVQAAAFMIWLEIGGVFGGVGLGFITDRFFGGNRIPTIAALFIFQIILR